MADIFKVIFLRRLLGKYKIHAREIFTFSNLKSLLPNYRNNSQTLNYAYIKCIKTKRKQQPAFFHSFRGKECDIYFE